MAIEAQSGATRWSTEVFDYDPGDSTERELAVAPGLLLVRASSRVVAYESALRPAADGIAMVGNTEELTAGGRLKLTGVLGREVRKGRPDVSIDLAHWRGGGFRGRTRLQPARDGGFGTRLVVTRNARVRASAGGAASAELTVYAWPTVKLGRAALAGRNRIRLGVEARAPDRRLGGRTFVLYLDRRRTKGLSRLDSGRLRGGRRARTVLEFPFPRNTTERDTLYVCIRGQLALDLGRPSPLTRRCGAARLPEP